MGVKCTPSLALAQTTRIQLSPRSREGDLTRTWTPYSSLETIYRLSECWVWVKQNYLIGLNLINRLGQYFKIFTFFNPGK